MWTIYQSYEQQKRDNQQFDFDDMAIACLHMLTEQPELLKRYQERFQYILVDEFQDINPVQYQLIQLLAGESEQLFCVGMMIKPFTPLEGAILLSFLNSNKTILLLRSSIYMRITGLTIRLSQVLMRLLRKISIAMRRR